VTAKKPAGKDHKECHDMIQKLANAIFNTPTKPCVSPVSNNPAPIEVWHSPLGKMIFQVTQEVNCMKLS